MYSLLIILVSINGIASKDLKLIQVVTLSRHNMRTPYTAYMNHLTPQKWPSFNVPPGHLTDKGARMERYMGKYFYEWMRKERLIPHGCPGEAVFIYSNCMQRTVKTATAFVEGAFTNCDVPVHFKNCTYWDPVFTSIIKNTSNEYKKAVINEMKYKMSLAEDLLKPAYARMNEIVDLKHSRVCTEEKYCSLNKYKNSVIFEVGRTINVTGPLFIGNSIADAFVMSYYDDKPSSEVGWGLITRPEHWQLLTKVTKENQNVRYNLTTAGKDLSEPLMKYMSDIFLGDDEARKFTLLVGHDSNIICVTNVLNFKPFVLPNQYELFPVGGKLVFQKWTDGFNEFLKVEYVYQSWMKLREGAKVSLDHPPQIFSMEIKGCSVDERGLCPWRDFVVLLNGTLSSYRK